MFSRPRTWYFNSKKEKEQKNAQRGGRLTTQMDELKTEIKTPMDEAKQEYYRENVQTRK